MDADEFDGMFELFEEVDEVGDHDHGWGGRVKPERRRAEDRMSVENGLRSGKTLSL